MKNYIEKIIVSCLVFAIIFNSSIFANKMIKVGEMYFLEDDNGMRLKNQVYDLGPNVGTYYFGTDGALVTGWYSIPEDDAIYFFVNNKKQNFGAMVFGFCYIDGYLRFFYPINGRLAKADEGQILDIEGLYDVDDQGFLYTKDGTLCRDTSDARSDYYVDTRYYEDLSLNNRTLAETGGIVDWDGNLIGKPASTRNERSVRISNGAKAQLADKISDNTNVVVSGNIR